MDATRFYKLVCLLPVALVCSLTTAPALEAKESSTTESTDTQSASGTLVIVSAAKPESAADKSSATRAGNRTWRRPMVRGRGAQSAEAVAQSAEAVAQSIQLVSNQEVVAAPQQESAGSTAEMLVYAHELSKHASTEAEYEEIAVTCNNVERLGVSGEQREFALQLHAWANKHRHQMRAERIQQLRAEKAAQQLRARQAEQKLHVQRAKQQLLAAEAEEELRSRKIQQQLRAEKAEQELRAVKIQQQLRAEVAEQQLRAERAEQQLRTERADLELADDGSDAGVQELIRVDREEAREEISAAQSRGWQQLHDRGVTFAEQGKYAEAMDDFNRVIELNPMFAKVYSNRATLFTLSSDFERAQTDYQRACTLDPKLLHAQLGLGRVYHLLGSKEEALDCFNRAIELDPDKADIVCSRADLLADMGRYRDALADYARTIDISPEFAHAYRNGAWLLATCPDQRFRDPPNAVRGAQRALDFGYGDRHVALDTLAAAQASTGDFDQATETLQEALKIAPHEARYVYRSRLQRYQAHRPFFTEPVEDVSQVVYEVSDR
ncbi:MAG: tetratricopeptide repeat protein [Planctomycetes bacterium]|nr:tetratricopeptide repeat protein [Planctomycetota bacterium]